MYNTTENQGILDDWAAIKWLTGMLMIVAIVIIAMELI